MKRLRAAFPGKRVDALVAYIEAMRPIPAGTIDGKQVEALRLGATPVTWAVWEEFEAISGGKADKPSFAQADHPVVNVSAEDCDRFCTWLTNVMGVKFSLPSSTELEFAAREGGPKREFPWGEGFDDTKVWWSVVQERSGTAPVTRKSNNYTNKLGLSDMSGNVWQWCRDGSGTYRYVKGGCWILINADYFRCAFRYFFKPSDRVSFNGFRLASPLPTGSPLPQGSEGRAKLGRGAGGEGKTR